MSTAQPSGREGGAVRVALIQPPSPDPTPNYFGPPHDLALAAALLQAAGVDVICRDDVRADAATWLDDLDAFITQAQPTCIGFFLRADQRGATFDAVARVRAIAPDTRVVLDGELPHLYPAALLTHTTADAVVAHEAEAAWPELIAAWSAGGNASDVAGLTLRLGDATLKTPSRPLPIDLDALPYPAYHLMDLDASLAAHRQTLGQGVASAHIASHHCSSARSAIVIESARGCSYRCSFCVESTRSSKIRAKSPGRVADEIAHFHAAHGVDWVVFSDSLFTWDRSRVLSLCDALVARQVPVRWTAMTRTDQVDPELLARMAVAGCAELAFGVESGAPTVQRAMAKKLPLDTVTAAIEGTAAAGIAPVLMLMVGNEGETRETVRETLALVRDLNPHRVLVKTTKIEPGTRLHQAAEAAGLVSAARYLGREPHPPANTLEHDAAELDVMRSMLTPRHSFIDLQSFGADTDAIVAALDRSASRSAAVSLGASAAHPDPTLRADLPQLVQAAAALGVPGLALHTTAETLHPPRRVSAMRAWGGIACVHVPLMGHDAAGHDGLTERAGSFARALRGLSNWRDAGGRAVIRLALTKAVVAEPVAVAATLRGLHPMGVELVYGRAPEGWVDVPQRHRPTLAHAAAFAAALRSSLATRGIAVTLTGVPACVAGDDPALIREAHRPWDELVGPAGNTRINLSTATSRAQVAACATCEHAAVCPGVDAGTHAELAAFHDPADATPLPSPEGQSLFGVPTDRSALVAAVAARDLAPADDLYASTSVHDLYVMHSFSCNLRCDYCWLWGETGLVHDKALHKKYRDLIPLDVMRRFIDALVPYGVRNLNLSGGEPLMSSSWRPLAEHARDIGLPIQLTTGGVLIDRHVDAISDLLDQVNVSINGPPSIAAKVRPGPPGHYAQMVRGMRELTERRARTGRGPLMRVLSTITHTNYRHVVELMEHLEQEGVEVDEWYFQFLIFNTAGQLEQQAKIHRDEFGAGIEALSKFTVVPEDIDFDVMWDQLQDVRARHPRVQFSAPLTRVTLERYYTNQKYGIVPNYCVTPWTEAALLPNGDVYTCPDLPIGNIMEQSFEEIWNGEKLRRLRERVSHRLFPTCTGCFHYWGERGIDIDRSLQIARASGPVHAS